MNEKKELASEASKISRAKLNSMHTFKSQKQLNFSEYQNMLNVIIQKDRDSDEYNRDCCDAKVIETQNMMKNLFSMGKVIISIQEFLSAIDTLQSKLLSLEETIQLSLKITKYAQGYEECLKEIARRKNHSNKMRDYIQKTNETFERRREVEISKRISFRKSYGDSIIPKLMPFLMKSEEEEEKTLPITTFNFTLMDNDLPDVKVENLEDEFSFIEIEDPNERLISLEEENAFLTERLSLLIKNSTNNLDSQSNRTKRVQEVEKEISMIKDQLEKERKSKLMSDKENRELKKKLQELDQSQSEKMNKLEEDIKNYENLIKSITTNL